MKKRSARSQGDSCCCVPGHERWVHLTWGILGLIYRHDRPLWRKIRATLEERWPGLIAPHPTKEVQEWAEQFFETPSRLLAQIPRGRPHAPEHPHLSDLELFYVCLHKVNNVLGASGYDKAAKIEELDYGLVERIWADIKAALTPGDFFNVSQRATPKTSAIVGKSPRLKNKASPKRMALRFASHIRAVPENAMQERIGEARKKNPDIDALFKRFPPVFVSANK